MKILLAFLVGMLWGVVPCLINYRIGLSFAKKRTNESVTAYSNISRLVSLAGFLVVFLVRNIVPLNTAAMLFGVAISLSTVGIYFTLRIASK